MWRRPPLRRALASLSLLLSLGTGACASERSVDGGATAAPVCPIAAQPASEAAPAAPRAHAAAPAPLLLKNARLIDGSGAAPREGVDLALESGRIKAIGVGLEAPAGAQVIDLGGRTLLPGLIDAHTHLLSEPAGSYAEGVTRGLAEGEADRVLRGADNAWKTLAAGFTTVRNVGGSLADSSLRDAIAAGRVPGPRMLVANHSIGITGGHCDHTNNAHPEQIPAEPDYRDGIADGATAVRLAVRYQVKHGADLIKICATGGVLSQGDGVAAPQLTPEEMQAIVDEAVRAGRKVAAHAHGNQGIVDAVKAGVHSIEHGSILDPKTVALMKKRGVFLVPTTYVGRYVEEAADQGRLSPDSAAKAKAIAPKMRASFALAYRGGVKIALGSDAGVFPHGDNARELAEMVRLGMKPMDAVVAATSGAAELLGLADVGLVIEGMHADLVAVDGDPLADISVVGAPALVIKGGVVYVQRW
ncbi:MAG: amidohydrolase family protein [Nannocystaceae bacterium]